MGNRSADRPGKDSFHSSDAEEFCFGGENAANAARNEEDSGIVRKVEN